MIAWQAERVLTFDRGGPFACYDNLDAFRAWTDFYVGYERVRQEGCVLGSPASEIIKPDLAGHDELASAFDQWKDIFRDGNERMQQLMHISAEADPTQLANLLLAALQGGTLLAQAARDIAPLKGALQTAIDYVQTFATSPGAGVLHAR